MEGDSTRGGSKSLSYTAPAVKEVAKRAGVSIATVSRVLSGKSLVSPELAGRVKLAAIELHYRPNRAARSLRARETRAIGVLVPDIENPFFTSIIAGIEEILQAADYTLLLANYSEDPERESRLLRTLAGESVDGIIFTPSGAQSREYQRLLDTGIPMVAVSRKPEGLRVDVVGVDNEGGAAEAVRHLLKLGHVRIAFVNGTLAVSTGREKEAGYYRAFREAGVPVDPRLILHTDWRHPSGSKAMNELLDLPSRPTAVFGGNNMITLGILEVIHGRGLQIPRDIAVVGFDDLVWATSLRPSLTAVAQPCGDVGRKAAELLLARTADPTGETRNVEFAATLIVRYSCGQQWKW